MDKPLRKSESNQMIINSVACMQKNSKKFENCVGFSTSRSERVNVIQEDKTTELFPLLLLKQTDARMECQVLLLSSGCNCQMVEVSNVSCCQIDDLSNPNGGWRNCKQKEVSNGGSVK